VKFLTEFILCLQKGCNFWHWELEYVIHLLEYNYLRDEAGVDALGWTEDKRMELKLKAEELAATRPGEDEDEEESHCSAGASGSSSKDRSCFICLAVCDSCC
jgi:hypothetical protein